MKKKFFRGTWHSQGVLVVLNSGRWIVQRTPDSSVLESVLGCYKTSLIIRLTHLLHPLSTAETHAADDCSDAGSNEDEAWRRLNKIMYYVFVCCNRNRKARDPPCLWLHRFNPCIYYHSGHFNNLLRLNFFFTLHFCLSQIGLFLCITACA